MSSPTTSTAPLWLPPTQPYRLVATVENGWSDQYGAVPLAAAHAGVTLAPAFGMRGVWQHGCHGPWMDFAPALQCYSAPHAEELPVFVAREDQAQLLTRHGHRHVRAIGLPIVYTSPTPAPRQPHSLLVVPTHTLLGEKFPDRAPFERYADEIREAAAGFDRVTVCVHPSCRQNGFWINEFSSRGFEIVLGALNTDRHALARVRALFEQFETVTTNGWGSHVAYALAFGARVSIHGTLPRRSAESLLRDHTWAVQPDKLRQALSDETGARERAWLADFCVPPAEARADVERGRWLIGAGHRLTPAQMREALAAMLTPGAIGGTTPQEAARTAMRAARGQARALAAAGQGAEAAQVLLRAVKVVVDTKDPLLIHQTLVEAAADMEPLDAPKAAYLGEQARGLAARLNLPARP